VIKEWLAWLTGSNTKIAQGRYVRGIGRRNDERAKRWRRLGHQRRRRSEDVQKVENVCESRRGVRQRWMTMSGGVKS
jgi:hypothetical protein